MNAPIGAARFRRHFAAAAAIGLAALGSGCSPGPGSASDQTCPQLVRATDADTIALFGPSGHALKDVVVAGKIRSGETKCDRETGGVAVKAGISIEAQRSVPAIANAVLPYFVALIDPQQNVLAQNAFELHVQFLAGEQNRRMPEESITVHLPTHSPDTVGQYTIIVGFQLTPEQLAFNRASHSQ